MIFYNIFFFIILRAFKIANKVTPTSATTAIHILANPKTAKISIKNLKIKAFEMPLSNITGRLKQHALLGFLDALSIGEKLSETCKQDYYNYIKRQRKKYISLIFKYTVLLDILCEQKMLTVYEGNELLTECDKKQRHEIKNRLSEYNYGIGR